MAKCSVRAGERGEQLGETRDASSITVSHWNQFLSNISTGPFTGSTLFHEFKISNYDIIRGAGIEKFPLATL